MDSREIQAPPPSAPPNMMVGPTSYPTAMSCTNNNNASSMISPNSMGGAAPTMMGGPGGGGGGGGRFPFNSIAPQHVSKPLDSLASHPYDGSSSPGLRPCASGGSGGGFNIDSGSKKKRGRPRKYSPDGNIALQLAPTPISSSTAGHGDSSNTPSSEPSAKKNRGRPPGSGKRQLDALGICFFQFLNFVFTVHFFFPFVFLTSMIFVLLCVLCVFAGVGGIGFTPHVIMVKAGEVCGFSGL